VHGDPIVTMPAIDPGSQSGRRACAPLVVPPRGSAGSTVLRRGARRDPSPQLPPPQGRRAATMTKKDVMLSSVFVMVLSVAPSTASAECVIAKMDVGEAFRSSDVVFSGS